MFGVADAVPIPVSINIGVGSRNRPATPAIPLPRLAALGVRRVSLPRMLPVAAIRAMEQAAALLRHSVGTRERVDRSDLLASIDDIKAHMDCEEPEPLEERFLLPDHLLQRYGSRRVGIRGQRRSARRRTCSSWARALIEDGAGGVAGAVREGGSRIGARAVILAGHGFGADRELLARFCAEIAGALHVGAPEDPTIEALAARRSPDPAALRGTLEAAAARAWPPISSGEALRSRRAGTSVCPHPDQAGAGPQAGRAVRGHGCARAPAGRAAGAGSPCRQRSGGGGYVSSNGLLAALGLGQLAEPERHAHHAENLQPPSSRSSEPSARRMLASRLSPESRAAAWPCCTESSAPTTPVTEMPSARRGPAPDRNSSSPPIGQGTSLASGARGSGSSIPGSARRRSAYIGSPHGVTTPSAPALPCCQARISAPSGAAGAVSRTGSG
jgi:hypothetical protein